MFRDYCRCASTECENYARCMRGGAEKFIGIYTVSYLGKICNKNNGYPELITKEQWYGKESNNDQC